MLAALLIDALATVDRPGDFYASGQLTAPLPLVRVDGVGAIAFPLLDAQADALIARAERAPYGRGAATLVDPAVRRTWQLGADQVTVGGAAWATTLAHIVAEVRAALGVPGDVTAELYKLLLYDEGSFFVEHRDTEKTDGMFATLVIVLPSLFTGGALVVRHGDAEVTLALQSGDPSVFSYAAFYADCLHEVQPVVHGKRAALVYNLVRTSTGPPLTAPDRAGAIAEVAALLARWPHAPDPPRKLILPLEHEYSSAGLAFDALKGRDEAVARVLTEAAAASATALHLAIVSIEEWGGAEPDFDPWRARRDGNAAETYSAGDVEDRAASLVDWRRMDGRSVVLPPCPVEEDEVAPEGALNDLVPDEERFTEATGNAGATFERTYRKAAFVLWPDAFALAVRLQAGLGAALPFLAARVAAWEAAGEPVGGPLWDEAHAAATAIADAWNHARPEPGVRRPESAPTLLALLGRLRASALTARWISRTLCEPFAYDAVQNPALIAATLALPPALAAQAWAPPLAAQLTRPSSGALALIAGLLDAHPAPAVVDTLARALTQALPSLATAACAAHPGRDRAERSAHVVSAFALVLRARDEARIAVAVAALLAVDADLALDAVLAPIMAHLLDGEHADRVHAPPLAPLTAATRAHLSARIAARGTPTPPANQVRAYERRCGCADCKALASFMADSARTQWHLRARQDVRDHVESHLGAADVRATTLRQGSPHTLVITKTDATYQRLRAAHDADVALAARLG